jgi:UDP-glucuronate decarboxylase
VDSSNLTDQYFADSLLLLERDLNWKAFEGLTFLVTGATGFLGKYIIHALHALNMLHRADIKIKAVVRDINRAQWIFHAISTDPNVEFVQHDFNSKANLELHGDLHYVIHAASIASPSEFVLRQQETMLPNIVGTIDLLRLANESPDFRGFLYLSSSEVYGKSESLSPIDEGELGEIDITSPRSVYAESKRSGELICHVWERSTKIPVAIARPFHTYGIGLRVGDGRAFAEFINNGITGVDISITGDASVTRAYCHAIDALDGFFRILSASTVTGTFNVGNPAGVLTILELGKLIEKISPKTKLYIKPPDVSLTETRSPNQILIPDISRMKRLNWEPKISPREGLERIINAKSP